MNNLSWFIYLPEVVPNIGVVAIIVGLALLFMVAMSRIYTLVEEQPFTSGWLLYPAIALFTFAALTPSTQTIYLIAGSEAGEMVVTSEEGQAILEDIHEIIRAQLESLKTGAVQ